MADSRSIERLRHHFEVERELGERLRRSTREERRTLLGELYDELFRRVPDHPRLTRRDTPESSAAAIRARLRLVEGFLTPSTVFLEIAPGDCRFCHAVAPRVREAIGADISDQTGGSGDAPPNFRLLIWNGSIDLAFSYQLLEHLHPDDVADHLRTVRGVLRPGGRYVVSTPHRYSGPHDVSRHFSDTPAGLHLQEWTFRELALAARAAGFARLIPFRRGRLKRSPAGRFGTLALESLCGLLPARIRRRVTARLFQSVNAVLEA